MKKLFALLLFLMVPLAPVGAQGLHGKIALIIPQGQTEPVIEGLLPAIYNGEVDVPSAFSFDSVSLSMYDAILLFPSPYTYSSDSLTIVDKLALIDYLKNGGRIYAESEHFLSHLFDTTFNPEDTLWHFLGLKEESVDALEDSYDVFFGVDSEFTRGLSVPHAYDPTNPDVGGTYYPIGDFIPVLFGEEVGGGDDIFAWIPADTSIRAVMHHALDFEYYAPFLTRVLCDYFGLCVDGVKETPPAVPTATLRVVNDGVSTSLVVTSEESGIIDIENALGVSIYHVSVNSGTSSIELTESLRNGVYFARWHTEHGGQVQPFAIVAK